MKAEQLVSALIDENQDYWSNTLYAVSDLEQKSRLSRDTFKTLQGVIAKKHPHLKGQADDLSAKVGDRHDKVLRLRFAVEFEKSLEMIGLKRDQVSGMFGPTDLSYRNTLSGKLTLRTKPDSIVGVLTKDGQKHVFKAPIRRPWVIGAMA